MDSIDVMEFIIKTIDTENFWALDRETQRLYINLVMNAKKDLYLNDFDMDDVFNIAQKIGIDGDDAKESVEALVDAGYLSLAVNVNYNRESA